MPCCPKQKVEVMSDKTFRYIVLTGTPGCGKTTLVKKACDILRVKDVTLSGFFTEEVRSGRERIGFDVVLTNGNRTPLARVKSGSCKEPFVGKYAVEVNSFESCVLPTLTSGEKSSILVLDEIGKMELLSDKFKDFVSKCIGEKRVLLATVPAKTARPISLVEMIKNHPDTCLITVDRENRDKILDKIISLVLDAQRKGGI